MATARHPKATFFVQRHLFAGLTSFAGLESKIAALPDEQSRGAAFEVFAEAYLATQRKYDAAQVWPHGSVPLDLLQNLGLTQQDQGVDGVLQTLLGQFNAYQIKFRTGRPSLTWRELSTFIGLADSPHIHSRVLLTNCDELPAVLNDRQGFFCIRGADLDRLEADDFRAMEAWLADAAFIAPKKSPQPHQTEALDALLPALQTHDRVSAIMACGTGKTLVALWVAEKLVEMFASREATNDNSPAFQRRVQSAEIQSPVGTTEISKTNQCHGGNNASSGQPSRRDLMAMQPHPGVETPGYVSGCPVGTNDGGSLAAKILVLLPSLALLRQTLHEWLRETHLPSLAYLCVCSDPTVKEGIDALTTQQSDLDFQVSTDPASVRRFLDAPFAGVKIIFSTYQSASVVGAAMQPGAAFDFAVFDEAHKTAGREGRNFAFALDDKNISIRKRLFLTATPRHYNPHDRDREGEARLLFSMDNPAVYGPQAYRLTFAEAARRGIICGYKVIISVITSEMVTNELLSHGEVLVNGNAVRARQVANQIALRDAIEKYGVQKVFTFHRDVKSAQSFVSAGPEGVGTHLADVAADVRRLHSNSEIRSPKSEMSQSLGTSAATGKFQTFHVNGSMPTARRERELRDFRAAARAVVSNARCLTEGVDVPAVDMVAFLSPRRSRVDIVQATGRAMRRSPGKTTGYVLVPLYLEQTADESIEEAVNRAEFDQVWDVLQSLQEQDEVLAEIIREMREECGRTKGFDDSRFREIVEVESLLPQIALEMLRKSITTVCMEWLGVSWNERYGQLVDYKHKHGDCDVPINWHDNLQMADWVSRQRQLQKCGKLSEGRMRRLDDLGFIWDARKARWEDIFTALVEFKRKHGNCNVPALWRENQQLATWVQGQRIVKKSGKLGKERAHRLKQIGFIWEPINESWEKMFTALADYTHKHGNCNIPSDWPENQKLANWASHQREFKKSGKLSEHRMQQLEEIGFAWGLKDESWEKMFTALAYYTRKHGNCKVPTSWRDNPQLASWVVVQRTVKKSGKLSKERIRRLEQIGFIWEPNNESWEKLFAALVDYKRKYGNCNVPSDWYENQELGSWANTQRQFKKSGKLSQERTRRLKQIGFVWDLLDVRWKEMFTALVDYKRKHRNCNVPQRWRENRQLATWVSNQRHQKSGKLDEHRIRQLDDVGFVWDPGDAKWDERFEELVCYKRKYGDCNVPALWRENQQLGRWMHKQRQLRGKLGKERVRRLNSIGFQWKIILGRVRT